MLFGCAIFEQAVSQFFRKQLHLREGAGFDAALVDGLRQREAFDFAHGNHDALAGLDGGGIVYKDVGDLIPARVDLRCWGQGHGVSPSGWCCWQYSMGSGLGRKGVV